MSRILESLTIAVLLATSVWAQQPQDTPTAPIPVQLGNAKKVFISNAGEEAIFRLPKDAPYSGGPNRTYNQFYAAMKSWGRYDLVSAPADADLVFQIGFTDKYEGPVFVSQIKLVVVDPKTHITLWTFTKYVEFAGMAKNREKNYDVTMTALMDDMKSVLAAPVKASSN